MKEIGLTKDQRFKLITMMGKYFPHTTIINQTIFATGNEEIHWFEFTMTYLTDKLYDEFYAEVQRTQKPKNIFEKDIFYTQVLALKTIHPIDYLYEHFIKILC